MKLKKIIAFALSAAILTLALTACGSKESTPAESSQPAEAETTEPVTIKLGVVGSIYAFGGVASGEHGIGLTKRHYFLRETSKENLAVMNQIKDALDPQHILNDQKSYIVGGTEHAELV